PWFMAALFGTGLVCAILAVAGIVRLGEAGATYHLVGGVLYLPAIVLTIAYHVPRNDALAAVDPASADAADVWARYLDEWTAWNHARTIAPIAALVTLLIGLIRS
ncbi:MAG: DUF1772 domain-containing protein, partial [Ilumatobacteraceae bacterium]